VCDSNGFELYNNVEEEGIDIMIAFGDNTSHRHRGSKAILPQRENRRQSAKKYSNINGMNHTLLLMANGKMSPWCSIW
jgi:hypothetical protein